MSRDAPVSMTSPTMTSGPVMVTPEPATVAPEDTPRPGPPSRPPRLAPRRLTSATMTVGVVVSAACFLVALASELLSGMAGSGATAGVGVVVSDLATWLGEMRALDPEAWASLGTLVLVATPALGLVASAAEYARVGDRRTVGLALLVLAVLAVSAVVAVSG